MSTTTKAKDLVLQVKSNMGSASFRTSYSSLPVDIPDDFLAPLPDPSVIKTHRIDFKKTPLPEYDGCYAVILDNVLSQQECDELIHLTEKSAGAHRDHDEAPNNGWRPAMVNAGPGHEFLDKEYRNSDRIIWDNGIMTERIFKRVLQGKGIREDLSVLEGEEYVKVLGDWAGERGERWVLTTQDRTPLNERMRFLKYGPGQFFRPHCDGAYHTPDGTQQTFYTLHLYLNDSAQELEKEGITPPEGLLRGGATTFHARRDTRARLDVDPKAGRVLIFQHRRLLHSGDDVMSGIKYTMRSDIMYEFEGGSD